MDFANKSFSGVFKIIIAIIVITLFMRVLPWVLAVGIIVWAVTKVVKYFRNWKNKKNIVEEKVDVNSTIYDERDEFDFSEKKIIDVEYKDA